MADKVDATKVRVPDASTRVQKEECVFSFENLDTPDGIYVSLTSFLSFSKHYAAIDSAKTGNTLYLNIKRRPIEQKPEDLEPPKKKATVLGIGVEGGFDANTKPPTEDVFALAIAPEFVEIPLPNENLPAKVLEAIAAVKSSQSIDKVEEVASWVAGQDVKMSEHALTLEQVNNGKKVPPSGWKCEWEGCDQTSNLWMNLSDGTILCGRRQPDGSGGNGHALAYYEKTKYPLSVKLATITPEGGGDVYSYVDDDAVQDIYLVQHLAHFGIDVAKMKKTENTILELELDAQYSLDMSRIEEKGQQCLPAYGPGFTGLTNLGNSCYMASIMQVLFSIPAFQKRYFEMRDAIFHQSPADPSRDFHTQMAKLGHGLLSGEYSKAPALTEQMDTTEGETASKHESSIRPRMFKSVVGAGHPEFSSMRQQDALEFYQHLMNMVQQKERAFPGEGFDPSLALKFKLEDRIVCDSSHRVRLAYRTDNILSLPVPLDKALNKAEVEAFEAEQKELEAKGDKQKKDVVPVRPIIPLQSCLEEFAAEEKITDFFSSAINARTTATKSAKLATFPEVLVLHIRKFILGPRWEPKKLDIFLQAPETLDLEWLRAKGLAAGEQSLEDGGAGGAGAAGGALTPDEGIISQLGDMGFGRNRAARAAIAVRNSNAEDAMNWLFAHMEDPDIDDPLPAAAPAGAAAASSGADTPNEDSIAMLSSMGFSREQAIAALRATNNDVERATDWIFSHAEELDTMLAAPAAGNAPAAKSGDDLPDGPAQYELLGFISHMGASTHSGHYVCHIKKDGRWVKFNDEKVDFSEATPFDMGYLYFYQRIRN